MPGEHPFEAWLVAKYDPPGVQSCALPSVVIADITDCPFPIPLVYAATPLARSKLRKHNATVGVFAEE